MSTLPFISVVIPCRNEVAYIAKCVESVMHGTYAHEQIEILIIDAFSDDGTREIVLELAKSYPLVKLLDNKYKTVPFAMNIGITQARGEIIVRLDCHADYPSNYVKQLVKWMDKLNADNVGGVLTTLPAKNTPESVAVAEIMSHPFGVGNSHFRIGASEPIIVDTVPFGCYRKQIFDKIGLYDEQLTRNQDDELNARLIKHGGKIYLIPEIQINYYARGSLKQMLHMFYQYGYFKPLVNIKIGYPTTMRQLVPPVFVLALSISFLFAIFSIFGCVFFALVLFSYLSVDTIFSAKVAQKKGWKILPYMLVGFLFTHLSYGAGYLKGVVDFMLLKKHNKKSLKDIKLTR